MEQRYEIETPLGPVWMWGRDTGQPIALMITGAFAEFHVYDRLQLVLPQFDVLRTHQPGNHSPALGVTGVAATAEALSRAMTERFPGRPLMVIGLSTGALVAMAMKTPDLTALMLVEPFLRTRHIWVFARMLETFVEPQQREFLWKVMGVREGEAVERDYRRLVSDLDVPGQVMLGTLPLLSPRRIDKMPSLVDDADRATLRAQPLLTITEVSGAGHNVAVQDSWKFIELLELVARRVLPGAEARRN